MLVGDAEDVKEPPVPESFDVADADEEIVPKEPKIFGPLLAGGAEDAKEPPVP